MNRREMSPLFVICLAAALPAFADTPENPKPVAEHPLMKLLSDELEYSQANLAMPDGTRPYFMGYTITDDHTISISARFGSLMSNDENRRRLLDVDVRVGDYKVDSTHKLRGENFFDPSMFGGGLSELSLTNDPVAIRQALWLATDQAFKAAAKTYQRVLTNLKTKVEEESKADDFSRESPSVYRGPEVSLNIDRQEWARRIRQASALARDYPLIYDATVAISASAENRYLANSEGTRVQDGRKLMRVSVSAESKAEDGMDLSQTFIFNASREDKLPSEAEITAALKKVIEQVLALREAPLVEPYTGPAILLNRASGVFFHEIFGHRIEGHRQKDVEEGQTFTKMVGQKVLPDFLSVFDDPTTAVFNEEDLRGHYLYDDEGVPASRVSLIEDGTLKTFLLSRSPLESFPNSNGHGRRQPGRRVVSRQGNLTVVSSRAVPFDELRQLLVEECKKQDKPYGLLFEDITGGFTMTGRRGPQSFKVLPVVVYRVYADGRPDELVRGVDIVGTPLSCFSKIIHTGDDSAVFNGTCGAESGWVPVSAISPSILVSEIEIEKRMRDQDKPPILPPPIGQRGH